MKNEILVCEKCGSADSIQLKVWQYVNSGEFAADCIGEIEDRWCEDCEEHVDFVSKEEI
jgi:hypothetical protein